MKKGYNLEQTLINNSSWQQNLRISNDDFPVDIDVGAFFGGFANYGCLILQASYLKQTKFATIITK